METCGNMSGAGQDFRPCVRLCVGMGKAGGRLSLFWHSLLGSKAGLGGFVLTKSETEETGPLWP